MKKILYYIVLICPLSTTSLTFASDKIRKELLKLEKEEWEQIQKEVNLAIKVNREERKAQIKFLEEQTELEKEMRQDSLDYQEKRNEAAFKLQQQKNKIELEKYKQELEANAKKKELLHKEEIKKRHREMKQNERDKQTSQGWIIGIGCMGGMVVLVTLYLKNKAKQANKKAKTFQVEF